MSTVVREAFKDYEGNGNILDCIVENVDLFKKSKKIEIYLGSDKKVGLEELDRLEEYLKNKFQIGKVVTHIKYAIDIEEIKENDWEKITKYLFLKYPITKAILENSRIEINNNNISIILKTKNAYFMHSSEFDVVVSNLIANIYGKYYKVDYIEEVEDYSEQKRYLEDIQKKEIQEKINEIETWQYEEDINSTGDEPFDDLQDSIESPLILGRSEKIKEKIMKIVDINLDYGKVSIEGEVVFTDSRELKNGKILATYNIYDGTSTITCKSFLETGKAGNVLSRINNAKRLRVLGNVQYDNFLKEIGIIASVIVEVPEIEKKQREDLSEDKRVELHLHTQMSQMDGISSVTALIKRAAFWGMKAIAITDHGVVQAFPEANKAAKDEDIKVIYGVEAYLVPDREDIISEVRDLDTYVVFDIETTGLGFRTEKITEIRSN